MAKVVTDIVTGIISGITPLIGDLVDNAIVKPIITLLGSPGPPLGCIWGGGDYHEYDTGKKDIYGNAWIVCTPSKPKELFLDTDADYPNGIKWSKALYSARSQDVSSGLNCPLGTFPYDGLCHFGCPRFYTREVVPGTDVAPNIIKFECRAECSQAWHVMDWIKDENGNDIPIESPANQNWRRKKGTAVISAGNIWYPDYCYHILAKPEEGENLEMPWNLHQELVRTIEVNPLNSDGAMNNDDGISLGGDPPNYFYERGVYAMRLVFPLAESVLPLPCNPPNVISRSRRCLLPCTTGFTFIGDVCVNTEYKCPTNISKESDDKSACIPNSYNLPRLPGIGATIGILAAILVVGGTTALLVGAYRSKRDAAQISTGGDYYDDDYERERNRTSTQHKSTASKAAEGSKLAKALEEAA